MTPIRLEETILNQLYANPDFSQKVLPFLEKDFFDDVGERYMFDLIRDYIIKYKNFPTPEALLIDLNKTSLPEEVFKEASTKIQLVSKVKVAFDNKWLIENTEEWAKQQKLINAMKEGINILNDKNKTSKGKILEIMRNALSYTFQNSIGHDYIDDVEKRFEYYHQPQFKIPFDLDFFNKATDGGVSRKTLNILMAAPNVGKSLFMCHMAAHNLLSGYNVLYITMEMSREEIAKRIDANLLDTPIKDIKHVSKKILTSKVSNIAKKTKGKLIIEEYPTGGGHVGHFKALLHELVLKKQFKPDVMYVDYLNICASMRHSFREGSYTYVKGVGEELRGFGVEHDIPVITATQINREGIKSTDWGMGQSSDSIGTSFTADSMFGLMAPDDLKKLGQIKVKHIKSRYTNVNEIPSWVVGVDYDRMKLYDVEDDAQGNVSTPVFDQTPAGKEFNLNDFEFD